MDTEPTCCLPLDRPSKYRTLSRYETPRYIDYLVGLRYKPWNQLTWLMSLPIGCCCLHDPPSTFYFAGKPTLYHSTNCQCVEGWVNLCIAVTMCSTGLFINHGGFCDKRANRPWWDSHTTIMHLSTRPVLHPADALETGIFVHDYHGSGKVHQRLPCRCRQQDFCMPDTVSDAKAILPKTELYMKWNENISNNMSLCTA